MELHNNARDPARVASARNASDVDGKEGSAASLSLVKISPTQTVEKKRTGNQAIHELRRVNKTVD